VIFIILAPFAGFIEIKEDLWRMIGFLLARVLLFNYYPRKKMSTLKAIFCQI